MIRLLITLKMELFAYLFRGKPGKTIQGGIALQDLFESNLPGPLADRIRPERIEDFIGQEHIVGEGKLLSCLLYTSPSPRD